MTLVAEGLIFWSPVGFPSRTRLLCTVANDQCFWNREGNCSCPNYVTTFVTKVTMAIISVKQRLMHHQCLIREFGLLTSNTFKNEGKERA